MRLARGPVDTVFGQQVEHFPLPRLSLNVQSRHTGSRLRHHHGSCCAFVAQSLCCTDSWLCNGKQQEHLLLCTTSAGTHHLRVRSRAHTHTLTHACWQLVKWTYAQDRLYKKRKKRSHRQFQLCMTHARTLCTLQQRNESQHCNGTQRHFLAQSHR